MKADARNWFDNYTKSFAGPDGTLDFMLQLKYDHSLRVADDCRTIAELLHWPDKDIQLSYIIGLLHDIGRFTQFVEFKTFHDKESVDHGERGHEVLVGSNAVDALDKNTLEILLDSVRYHNRRELQTGINSNSLSFLKLIRDADKVDIIHIVNHAISNNHHTRYPEIMLNIDLDGPATPALIEEIKTTHHGTYHHVHSLTDINLMRVSWIYTINYQPTYQIIAERNLLDDLFKTLPNDKDVREIIAAASDHLRNQLASA